MGLQDLGLETMIEAASKPRACGFRQAMERSGDVGALSRSLSQVLGTHISIIKPALNYLCACMDVTEQSHLT